MMVATTAAAQAATITNMAVTMAAAEAAITTANMAATTTIVGFRKVVSRLSDVKSRTLLIELPNLILTRL